MIFMVNGVIRSFTNNERMNEMKLHLLGKNITISDKEQLTVKDIVLTNHNILFIGQDDNDFEMKKVKKIEIDSQEGKIRIITRTNRFIILLS